MTAATEVLAPGAAGTAATAAKSGARLFWERFREDKAALGAAVVIGILIFLAFFGGPIAEALTGHAPGHGYNAIMLDEFGLPKGPNAQFWFGADGEGHDVFVRTMYGARTSLTVGVLASLFAVLIGLIVGLIAGFYRGGLDTLLSRFGDVMLSIPSLLISIGIVAACSSSKEGCILGPIHIQPGEELVIVIIVLFTWPYIARLVRGFTLSLREKEFVEASRSLGASNRRIIVREILPNLAGPMIVYTTLLIPQSILFEAALSYLGLGVPPSTASWGGLLNDAQRFYDTAWWLMLFPGLFLVITTLAFNLLGDGLRDALDVRADR
ncbi:MAG TPA: ABC transporter permease [Gaiellaceae bacterium]|jgi:peptide/nickel transport system permease protein|nr:ABC transporter permease [Gaiellaceae bacterium]